ncbi:MAG: rod shape-determining protein RodA [Fibrobacterales bacterium]
MIHSSDDQRVDVTFLTVLFAIISIGVLMVYSATFNAESAFYETYWFRQIIYFVIGAFIAGVIVLVPPKVLYSSAYPLYFMSLLTLAYVGFGGGESVKGAARWISIGGFRLQPSEFAKIAYLLAMSRMLSQKTLSLSKLKGFIGPGVLFIVPFGLVLGQPDLSTALVFMVMTLIGFYWAGLSVLEIIVLISPAISVVTAHNQYIWMGVYALLFLLVISQKLDLKVTILILLINLAAGFGSFMLWNNGLKEHQRSRILTFVDPMRDPKGAGYQVIQSKVTIGSGGIYGKGFGKGTQVNNEFLPEEHTDFIFCVLSEQFGLIGCAVVLLLYFMLIQRMLSICRIVRDGFLNFMIIGITAILSFHIFVNIAMTLGMMPVTGLPLPFFSYGGSFVMTCMVLVGLVINIRLKGESD